jgi:hypothetical protein
MLEAPAGATPAPAAPALDQGRMMIGVPTSTME